MLSWRTMLGKGRGSLKEAAAAHFVRLPYAYD